MISSKSPHIYLSISRLAAVATAVALVTFVAPGAPAAPPLSRPQVAEPNVTCARCIVVDPAGRVLWARDPRDRYPNASTTKMATALVTVARVGLGEAVSVSATAGGVGGGGLDLQAGDVYTVEALLYALLLDSSNESAVALAEHVSGSEAEFVDEMNALARSLGARRTHFSNAHGLDAEGHYASAADLATIGAEVLRTPPLDRIVATADATIQTPRGAVGLENRNLLLESYPGAIGIKTGRTLGAGNVLVAAARRDGQTLIAVAMNSYDTFADSAALLDFGFAELKRLRRSTLVGAGETVGAIVFDGIGTVEVEAAAKLSGLPPASPEDLSVTIVPGRRADLPIAPGEEVGLVQVATPSGVVGTTEAIAGDEIPTSSGGWIARALAGVLGTFGPVVRLQT